MRKPGSVFGVVIALCALNLCSSGFAQEGVKQDVFEGKLFAPNIILEHQAALQLSDEQLGGIRSAVVNVQGAVASHEWDLREAYQEAMAALDESPVDEEEVMKSIRAALQAENEVKQLQVAMLIQLRNLLTTEQLAYLRSVQ